MSMLSKNSKFAYNVIEYDTPVNAGLDAEYSKVVEVTTVGWAPSTVDVWGDCLTCNETVRVEDHSHSHVCELDSVEGCSWIAPEAIQASWLSLQESKLNRHVSDTGLIPPESINDWDSSLYFDDTQVSTKGKRTHRVNGVITYTDKFETLPEVSPKEKPQDTRVFKHRCEFCKKGFNSTFWYVHIHTCKGSREAKIILRDLQKPVEQAYVKKVVRVEAALTEHWSEADRNRVPSELGKLDWLNPKQD
mgnify:CR=1 FL=1|tara:strand:- start:1359 stop:2099 length:741 start_codon:yes stop_codon:yes gene_type:complete